MRAQQVVREIQDLIRREEIPPGGRLPTEHALARRFRVSRPVVREALQALRALGVVDSRPKRGLRVLPFDPAVHFDQLVARVRTDEERRELYELRRILEPGILRLVARRARREDLEALGLLAAEPLPPGRAAVREGLARDVAFHEGLWRLAGNRFVWSLRGLLVRYFADLERRRERRLSAAALRRAHAQHAAIVRALLAGNVERAVRILERNLDTFRPPGVRP